MNRRRIPMKTITAFLSAAAAALVAIAMADEAQQQGSPPRVSSSSRSSSIGSSRMVSSWSISEDYGEDFRDRDELTYERKSTQIALDPLQICLYPTPLELPKEQLQHDMRLSMEYLVSKRLYELYSESFVYFAFTDAVINRYSGSDDEEGNDDKSNRCGNLDHVLPRAPNKREVLLPGSFMNNESGEEVEAPSSPQPQQQPDVSTIPCTCALYKGAVVLLRSTSGSSGSSSINDNAMASSSNKDPSDGVFIGGEARSSSDMTNSNNNSNNDSNSNKNYENQRTPEALEPKIEYLLENELVHSLQEMEYVAQGEEDEEREEKLEQEEEEKMKLLNRDGSSLTVATLPPLSSMMISASEEEESLLLESSSLYREIKGAIISWNVAERQQGDGKLVLRPNDEEDDFTDQQQQKQQQQQQLLRKSMSPTVSPVTHTDSDSSSSSSPKYVAGLNDYIDYEQVGVEMTGGSSNSSNKGSVTAIIIAVVAAVLFALALMLTCWYVWKRYRLRKSSSSSNNGNYTSNSNGGSKKGEDDQPHLHGGKKGNRSNGGGGGGGARTETETVISHEEDEEDDHHNKNSNDTIDDEERGSSVKKWGRRNKGSSSSSSKGRRLFPLSLRSEPSKKNSSSRSTSQSSSASASKEDDNDNGNDTSSEYEVASEMAQYERGELLECISVGSDWTLGTNTVDGFGSLASLGTISGGANNPYSSNVRVSNSKTMAELLAVKETFDRERHVTLQKDMLHSEWSGGVATTGIHPLYASNNNNNNNYVGANANNRFKNRRTSTSIYDDDGDDDDCCVSSGDNNDPSTTAALFQQANGQGEEIFLMPPRAASRKHSSSSSPSSSPSS